MLSENLLKLLYNVLSIIASVLCQQIFCFLLTTIFACVKIISLDKGLIMKNKIFSAVFGVAVFFFILSFSIGLPIYCRFFYYAQINALNLPEQTGYSFNQIKSAYDQMLNYLVLPNQTFSTGVFKFNEQGALHFKDCKVLFDINLIALICSSIILSLTLILVKAKKITLCRPFNMSVSFVSASAILIALLIIGVIVAIDFSSAFTVFHHIFFAGKDNWIFDPNQMEVIKILPEQFFLNCAILIGASILIICLTIIIYQLYKRKNLPKR